MDDRIAVALRGFGPVGILAILVILAGNLVVVPLSGIVVLVWARRSRTPWREIGYVRPESWIGSAVLGIAFGSAFKLLMKMIVMPLLDADPINQRYHYLAGNRAAVPAALYAMIFGLVFGTIVSVTRRIWMLTFAHTAFDLTALAIIYWNLESTVAHLVFK